MTKLKPCPFCGKDPFLLEREDFTQESWDICCGTKDCLLEEGADWYSPKNEIIDKWNKRE